MKILICPDKFKESLKARDVADFIQRGFSRILPGADYQIVPLADGGEGTVDVLVSSTNGRIIEARVHDPLMRPIQSFFGISGDGAKAFIEMSAASGMALLRPEERDPMITTTFGTGELIRDALSHNCSEIIIGLGGSATVDAGVGMAQALGVRFTDKLGKEEGKGGGVLNLITKIDFSELHPQLKRCRIIAASDVNNVFTGMSGAARVFGPQKGANPEQVTILDNNLLHLAGLIKRDCNIDLNNTEGSGAAGGLGGGIVAFLGGEIRRGFDVVAGAVELEKYIRNADLIITGEGKIDNQTVHGKTPAGVARMAAKYKKPVIAFAGTVGESLDELYKTGISVIVPIADKPMSLEDSMRNAGVLLEAAAERTGRLLLLRKGILK